MNFISPNDYNLSLIMECINNNLTLTETAKKLNYSKPSLSRYCVERNIDFKAIGKVKFNFSKEQLQQIVKYLEEGCSYSTLANYLDLNEYVIKRLIKENNIVKKYDNFVLAPKGAANLRKKYSQLNIYEFNEIYIEKCNELADEINELKNSISKNPFYDKYIRKDITDEQIAYIKEHYQIEGLRDLTKKTKLSWNQVAKILYSNRLFWYSGVKRLLKIEDPDFENDIGNVNMSSSLLAKKYNTSSTFISSERKRRFGDTFNYIFNPQISRTTIEYVVEEILQSLDIIYMFQKPIKAWNIDFYLGHKICIECNGLYWHKNKVSDDDKKDYLLNNDYKLLILEEEEFENKSKIENKIKEFYFGSLRKVICVE